MMVSATDLVRGLREIAARIPDTVAFEFWEARGSRRSKLTYGELDRRARALGARLQERGAPRDRVLLLCPPGFEFIVSFFACLYARQVAVPVPAPHPMHLRAALPRIASVAESARPRALLGTGAAFQTLAREPELARSGKLVELAFIDAEDPGDESEWTSPSPSEHDLAFLQYTSGSTASPKGVMLTHRNLMANVAMISEGLIGPMEPVRGVFWLPLYHDMGLIGSVLGNIFRGGTTVLMAPVDFLKDPLTWLSAISETRANISGAPNFGYQMAVERTSEEDRAGLDLSSWQVAFCGAERIRAHTLRAFARAFAPHGFRASSLVGCYGLAEATLLVSSGPASSAQADFSSDDARDDENADSLQHVSCGRIARGLDVAIVEPMSLEPLPCGQIGEIWVSGASVAEGYWQHDRSPTFGAVLPGGSGDYMRTGDLGYIEGGELFVTGRIKELIIVNGQNHSPEDIEGTVVAAHPALARCACAAFAVEREGDERVVVAIEVHLAGDEAARQALQSELESAVRRKVSERHSLHVADVVLVGRGRLPRTSSGKLQRLLYRQQYLLRAVASGAQALASLPEREEPGRAVASGKP